MRIYLVITPFYPEHDCFGGPYVEDQVQALIRLSNFRVIVIKPYSWYSPKEDYEINGVRVYRCPSYSLPSNAWPNAISDFLSGRAIAKKIRSLGYEISDIDYCHCHVASNGALGNYLKQINPRMKLIVQHHGFDVMGITDGRFARLKIHKYQCIKHGVNICNKADVNIGVSQKTMDYVLSLPNIKIKKQYVLYNGVDTSSFYPSDASTNKDESKQKIFTIGCVGNFWELKDQMTLIKAAQVMIERGVKDFVISFVGRGYNFENCYNYVLAHNLLKYFRFTKMLFHNQLPDFYRNLDLFVLPSYWEAFGCVYTEAYACGVPFVGVKGQGIAEIIPKEDEDKWLIDKGDYPTLADIILRVKSHPEEKQQLTQSIDINDTISNYLKQLEAWRN